MLVVACTFRFMTSLGSIGELVLMVSGCQRWATKCRARADYRGHTGHKLVGPGAASPIGQVVERKTDISEKTCPIAFNPTAVRVLLRPGVARGLRRLTTTGRPVSFVFPSALHLFAIGGAAFIVSAIGNEGETAWIEKILLVVMYTLLALAFFLFRPAKVPQT